MVSQGVFHSVVKTSFGLGSHFEIDLEKLQAFIGIRPECIGKRTDDPYVPLME